MLLPNAPLVAPVARRSSEMPPLKTNRFGSITSPVWNSDKWWTSTSYHCTCDDPATSLTECDVHSAQSPAPPLRRGSMAATAWVRRPSSVSMVCALLACGAGGGGANDGVATQVASPTLAVPSAFFVTLNRSR